MKRECFTPLKHWRVCAELFDEESFEQNLTVNSLLGLSFKPRRLALKKDAVPNYKFIEERCKSTIEKTNDETLANDALRTTSELLDHFPGKIRFAFRSKTFSTNDSLTQKRSSAQDNNDVTNQSRFHSFH